MSADNLRKAVYTGTFDPPTLGHLDVIRRGRLLFDEVVIGVGVNPNKRMLFPVEDRVELVQRIIAPFPNVSVEPFDDLAVQFVRRIGARIILRGPPTIKQPAAVERSAGCHQRERRSASSRHRQGWLRRPVRHRVCPAEGAAPG